MMKKRGLSENFLSELKDGYLQTLVDYVKQDETLFFAIRENYINRSQIAIIESL
jgi:hypothetical protein